MAMRVAVGSDDGSPLTQSVLDELKRRGFKVETHGALREGDNPSWPGTGVNIAANKAPGVRATLCHDAETAKGARLWNNANILCLIRKLTSPQMARGILDTWFTTEGIDPTEKINIDKAKMADAVLARAAPAGGAPASAQ